MNMLALLQMTGQNVTKADGQAVTGSPDYQPLTGIQRTQASFLISQKMISLMNQKSLKLVNIFKFYCMV